LRIADCRLPIEERDVQGEGPRRGRSWAEKFRDAFRGVGLGVRGQSSFRVHFFFAAAVIVAAAVMRVSLVEWCVLVLAIAVVLAAEMVNSALEFLARAITDEHDPRVAHALDVGSAAVLVAAVGAVIAGSLVFLYRLGVLAGWWP
jgi:diacylglycerol kinase